jgi:hypothetical protein
MNIATSGLLICILATPGAGETLRGVVSDVMGAPIKDAVVFVHWDPASSNMRIGNVGIKHDLLLKTDERGAFTTLLPPGFYDVFVSSPAFSPACRKIRIGKGAVVNVEERLPVSIIVMNELTYKITGEGKGLVPTLLPDVPKQRWALATFTMRLIG